MRLVPRSMAGQLLALLLIGLFIAHFIAVVMYFLGEAQIHPLSRRQVEERMAAAYLVASSHPDMAAGVLQAMSLPEVRYGIAGSASARARRMDGQERTVAEAVGRRLNLPAGHEVRVALHGPGDARDVVGGEAVPGWLRAAWADGSARALDVDVQLANGSWLHSRHWPAMLGGHWSRVLSFSVPVSTLPVLLIVIFFLRRILRPHSALAEAAERVSRGERVAPLPLQGPREVREITAAFNTLQARLGRFVEDRTLMLAAISHDLRTPITSLRIRAELVDDADLREAMTHTLNEMGAMVDETLRFARDESAHEATVEVDLATLVAETAAVQRELGRSIFHPPLPVCRYRCRPLALKRALGNLLENAAKYGRVWVTLHRGEGMVRIEVADEGPGIDPAAFERAFRPFARLDAARSQRPGDGVGLGLASARTCVQAHGGEIVLRNRPEGGLSATMLLPLAGYRPGEGQAVV